MEPTRSEANEEIAETPLIHGLPEDISLLCLARVPRTYHGKLKCVSKRWREMVCGEECRTIRRKYNLQETWLYALCEGSDEKSGMPKYYCYVLDPYAPKRCWKRIPDLPPCIVRRRNMNFEVLGTKAYLIGGRDIITYNSGDNIATNVTDEVYVYDAIANSWSKAPPMSTPRCHFASEVLDDKVYAVGSEINPNGKHTWEAYDSITNAWTAQSDPHVTDRSVESIVYNGKLYVRNSRYVEPSRACGSVYDPSTGKWADVDNDFLSGWHGVTVVADGRLYALDQTYPLKLRMWGEDKKAWMLVGELKTDLVQPLWARYCLVSIGKSIFFIGQGLCTVELDVSNIGKEGVLVTSDVTRPTSKISPIFCKSMTI